MEAPAEAPTDDGWEIDWKSKLILCGIWGRMGQGKSTLVRSIVKQGVKAGRWKAIVCFTPTPEEFWYLPEHAIYSKTDWADKFLGIFAQMDAYKERCVKDKKEPRMTPMLCLLDDTVGSNARLMYNPVFINILIRLRKFGPCDLIFTSQVPLGVPPVVRSVCSEIIAFRTQGHAATKKLFKFMGGMIDGGHREFVEVLNRATETPYSCLIYTANKSTFEESYISFTPADPSDEKRWKLKYRLPFKIS